MSLEILLVPLAIAATASVAEVIKKRTDQNRDIQYVLIETRMKDETLLTQALEEWETEFRRIDEKDLLQPGSENEAVFTLNEEGCYMLVLPETADREKYASWVGELERAYLHYLQQAVYARLLERAEKRGMVLEKEELLQDDSIQLTYVLNQIKRER